MAAISTILLTIAVLLTVIGLLQPVARRLRVPHSVLLALFGLGLGAAAWIGWGWRAELGPAAAALRVLTELPLGADAILSIFLPILLFQTGLTIDVRRMIDDIAPILLLAVVAVLVCTFAIGFALAPVAPVSLAACLLLGALVATTDPVAVIDVFRDVGAPRRLSILVEGESLFNDAAAIVLFTLLLAAVAEGASLSFGDGSIAFAKAFLGGVLFGWAAAWAAMVLMRPLRALPLAEISVSVALAYGAYLGAERLVDVSGVVAVVTAALSIAAQGRMRLSRRTWADMDAVWAQLGFWASSLIFVFAAMLVPRFVAQATWGEVGLLAIALGAAFVARAAVLWGLMPALSAFGLGERVDGPYKAVILWGGLRGAVTLALALAVTETPGVPPDVKRFVGVLATGFVFFTLLVNATTLRPVIRLLRLDRLSPLDRALRDRTIALALGNVADRLERAGREHRLDQGVIDRAIDTYRARRKAMVAEARRGADLDAAARERLGLIALANREEELYYEHFASGAVSRDTVVRLVAKAGRLRDAAKTGGREAYRRSALDSLQFRIAFRAANLMHRWLGLERPLARRLGDRFEMLLVSRMVIGNLRGFTEAKLTPLLGEEATEALRVDLDERMASCEQALEALRLQYPTYAEDLQQRFMTRAALRMEAEEIRVLRQESAITQEVYVDLMRRIDRDRREIERRPPLDLELSVVQLVRRFPMFDALDDRSLREICGLLKARLAVPGDRLVSRGERGDSMYFIASGAVEVRRESIQRRLGRGDFFGELALLTGRRRTADVTAIAYCRLLELPGRDFRRFLKSHPDVRDEIRKVADARLRDRTGEAVEAI